MHGNTRLNDLDPRQRSSYGRFSNFSLSFPFPHAIGNFAVTFEPSRLLNYMQLLDSRPRVHRGLALSAVLLLAASTGACLADIRPETLQKRTAPGNAERARAILNGGAAAQAIAPASRKAWLDQPGVRFVVEDAWHGFADLAANKWPESVQNFEFRFVPGKDAGVINFATPRGEPTGLTWGIHEWNTWKRTGVTGVPDYAADEAIKFNLPTVQYFLEMAMRLPDGEIVDYGGTVEIDGVQLEVVYITWGSYTPVGAIDQYVAYYRKDNGRLHHVDFTVRDSMPFVTAAARYKDFRVVQGYYVPFTIDITEAGNPESLLHRYSVQSVELNYELARTEYAPDANREPAYK